MNKTQHRYDLINFKLKKKTFHKNRDKGANVNSTDFYLVPS